MVVVDTNIVVYLLIEGDRTKDCRKLFALGDDWRSESFLLVEFSNVLATYLRGGHLREPETLALLTEAATLIRPGLETIPHATALRLAHEFDVSAYDARFLAVARRLGVPLVTEDARLRSAAPTLTRSLAEALE